MAINFTDSPADGATQVIGGRTYTYNSAKNKWDTTATEVVGPTATVYATVDNLPGTATTGDQAFVSGNNRLYIWNGSGWYNIALINNTPTISGVSSSYALAIDGTATTVTITATDPEGLPITYSIASDTSGNIATVTQGTGASSNVFTITPSTSQANAGSFTLTFRASDGVNIATAPASFTLQFSVENSNYTTALITSVGANLADNNDFVDSSTNSHTITAAGNATQTTFSPYRHGGYSTYFNGSSSLSVTNTGSTLAFGTGDVTVEGWINQSAAVNTQYGILADLDTSGAGPVAFWYNGTVGTGAEFRLGAASIAHMIGFRVDTPINEWFHFAYVRASGTWKFYLNGTEITTRNTDVGDADSYSFASFNPNVASFSNGLNMSGYMRDIRVVNGTAVYTSAFTPPTERLTAVTNTSLLTCHLPYIADGSTNDHAITVNGNTSTRPFAPYDYTEYSASSHGGSIYFDGSSDYLTIPSNSVFTLDGDFTIEGWFYSDGAQVVNYPSIISSIGWNTTSFSLRFNHTGYNNKFFVAKYGISGSGGANSLFAGTISVPNNVWNHFALVRSGTTCSLYVNGKLDTTATDSTDFDLNQGNQGTAVGGGNWDGAASSLKGSVYNLRVVKGTAVYTSAFTPPTAPLTAITNTSLLLSGTNAGIIDKSQSIKDYNNVGSVSSTAQSKYLSSSIYFDGVNDYARWTNNDGLFDLGFNGEPFTIEHWQYFPSIVSGASIGIQTGGGAGAWSGSNGHQLTVFFYSSAATLFYQWWNGSSRTDYEFNHGGAFTAATWQHFATVYDGTNLSTYVDGTRIGHRTSGNTFGSVTTKYASLGSNVTTNQGLSEVYYSDVRVTKGLARYSGTSFTVPSEALQG